MFLGWFDDTPKKSVDKKLEEAVERYIAKYGETPDVCLVSATDATHYPGLDIRVTEYVRPNHFWVGRGSVPAAEAAQQAA
jgi:hypothetical protein